MITYLRDHLGFACDLVVRASYFVRCMPQPQPLLLKYLSCLMGMTRRDDLRHPFTVETDAEICSSCWKTLRHAGVEKEVNDRSTQLRLLGTSSSARGPDGMLVWRSVSRMASELQSP